MHQTHRERWPHVHSGGVGRRGPVMVGSPRVVHGTLTSWDLGVSCMMASGVMTYWVPMVHLWQGGHVVYTMVQYGESGPWWCALHRARGGVRVLYTTGALGPPWVCTPSMWCTGSTAESWSGGTVWVYGLVMGASWTNRIVGWWSGQVCGGAPDVITSDAFIAFIAGLAIRAVLGVLGPPAVRTWHGLL